MRLILYFQSSSNFLSKNLKRQEKDDARKN